MPARRDQVCLTIAVAPGTTRNATPCAYVHRYRLPHAQDTREGHATPPSTTVRRSGRGRSADQRPLAERCIRAAARGRRTIRVGMVRCRSRDRRGRFRARLRRFRHRATLPLLLEAAHHVRLMRRAEHLGLFDDEEERWYEEHVDDDDEVVWDPPTIPDRVLIAMRSGQESERVVPGSVVWRSVWQAFGRNRELWMSLVLLGQAIEHSARRIGQCGPDRRCGGRRCAPRGRARRWSPVGGVTRLRVTSIVPERSKKHGECQT